MTEEEIEANALSDPADCQRLKRVIPARRSPADLCRSAVAAHHVGYPGLWPSNMLCSPPDK